MSRARRRADQARAEIGGALHALRRSAARRHVGGGKSAGQLNIAVPRATAVLAIATGSQRSAKCLFRAAVVAVRCNVYRTSARTRGSGEATLASNWGLAIRSAPWRGTKLRTNYGRRQPTSAHLSGQPWTPATSSSRPRSVEARSGVKGSRVQISPARPVFALSQACSPLLLLARIARHIRLC
jgi:hypothetical protein